MNKLIQLVVLISVMVLTGACKKDQNPRLPDDLKRASIPLITKAAGSDANIGDVNTFQAKFNADLYFKDDEKPRKMDVVVIFKGDRTNVKVLKADITAYPTAVTATAAQLAALFGKTAASLVKDDYFQIGLDVYMNSGLTVTMFSNQVAQPYGPDAANYPGSSLSIRYTKL
ncbi:hypothetical protein [Chitinophaga nivalis]|uniref:Uncharacterized protein n=1 Tax=Chitinophaga nivalis TaxID=2991709 RepID=A0ABT3IUB4_9BACT|nr:hypothetical protein [Chitinophaga nivalis]MCW3462718.1 hypothetical protein [Chitinophaga nivalis]MCW3487591.1 hypothetical protein [Chitinophaga nivalis]